MSFIARKQTILAAISACSNPKNLSGNKKVDSRSTAILKRVLNSGEPDHKTILLHSAKS